MHFHKRIIRELIRIISLNINNLLCLKVIPGLIVIIFPLMGGIMLGANFVSGLLVGRIKGEILFS
jgi:Na+/H+-translocating membrane pyrophosphatase